MLKIKTLLFQKILVRKSVSQKTRRKHQQNILSNKKIVSKIKNLLVKIQRTQLKMGKCCHRHLTKEDRQMAIKTK